LQDGSSVLSNTNENINSRLDGVGTSIDDEETIDPWQFRPKIGCRYLRVIILLIINSSSVFRNKYQVLFLC
jgi:hypothetical protein